MRPSVSVIVPFNGSGTALRGLLARSAELDLGCGDSLVIVDNRRSARRDPVHDPHVLRAPAQQSSYYARNRGAKVSSGQWLVFLDADVHVTSDLLDRYFDPPPDDAIAILAGAVSDGEPTEPSSWTECYCHRIRMIDQSNTLGRALPYAKTANCAVRRTAFEAVGGFAEGIRSGGDADLCFRIMGAGWKLDSRPGAAAEHRGRRTLVKMIGQRARHGSGAEWLNRRYPGFAERQSLWVLGRQAGFGVIASLASLARGDRDAAIMRALHPLATLSSEIGRRVPNRPWAWMLWPARGRNA